MVPASGHYIVPHQSQTFKASDALNVHCVPEELDTVHACPRVARKILSMDGVDNL